MKNKLFSLVICIAIVLFTVGTTLADRPGEKPDNGILTEDNGNLDGDITTASNFIYKHIHLTIRFPLTGFATCNWNPG